MDELKDKAELFTLISIFIVSILALTPRHETGNNTRTNNYILGNTSCLLL